jgi:hypothetical protein
MWQYAVCRTIAELKGYNWGINSSPTHDYFNGKNQMDFMNIYFGENIKGITKEFHEKWILINHVDQVNITMFDRRLYDIEDDTVMLGDNGAYGGLFQSEDYIINRQSDVFEWFNIKKEYSEKYDTILSEYNIKLDDDLCVINFRGGEYNGLHNVLLRREYWKDSINHMLVVNPNMKFLVITDDISLSKSFMPFDIPTMHVDVGFDFYVVNQSKWLIISNSSFGWWAAWLNNKSKLTIAPKYWARHNVSNGYWATGDVYSRFFKYMDREGNLIEYDESRTQAEEFYKKINIL